MVLKLKIIMQMKRFYLILTGILCIVLLASCDKYQNDRFRSSESLVKGSEKASDNQDLKKNL